MIHLTREVRCSLCPPENRLDIGIAANTWAGFPVASNLAPFVCLRATVIGDPEKTSGYLCDIKVIDDQLQIALDQVMRAAALNSDNPLTLLVNIWNELPTEFVPGARCQELQLLLSPYCRYAIHREASEMVVYTEQFEFSAAHRLHSPDLSEDENRILFGKCNNPNGHGHNYVVEVSVQVAQHTWQNTSRVHLSRTVKEVVLDRFDHKHLNLDTAEFREVNPTVENITKVVWDLLFEKVKPLTLAEVTVYETPKTWARYRGE